MKKRIVTFLLACVLAIGTVASPAGMENVRAEDLKPAEGIQYEIDGDGITITGYDGTAEELVIPADIDGVKVTSIRAGAFMGSSSLKRVELPEGLTNIGYWAFRDCSSLTSINIPESVTDIGTLAFSSTPWLEEQCSENGGLAIINHILAV